ncbi:MAG: hypothetical protein KIS81_09185 [Maricaulaceae bacterium]|nr:hypothetical protein [Maricaulaceae bacterium]
MPDLDDRSQTEKFKALARELECDEDEKVFDDKLRRIAQPKPPANQGEDDDKPGQ